MGEMIAASFSKIWHIIPIAIAVVLFKIYINKRDDKNRMLKSEAHDKNGLTIEVRAKKEYEEKGYTVQEIEEDGIDFIMTKEKTTLLVKCNNSYQSKSITDKDIRAFHSTALDYVKAKDMDKHYVSFRYMVPFKNVLHKSAIKLLSHDGYNCKYVVL